MSEEAGGNQLEDIRVSFTADLTKLDSEIAKFANDLSAKLKPITKEVSDAIMGPLGEMLPALKRIIDGLDGAKKDIVTVGGNLGTALGASVTGSLSKATSAAEKELKSHAAKVGAILNEIEQKRVISENTYRGSGKVTAEAELKALKEKKKALDEVYAAQETIGQNLSAPGNKSKYWLDDTAAMSKWAKEANKTADDIVKLERELQKLNQAQTGDVSAEITKIAAASRKAVKDVRDVHEREVKYYETYQRRLKSRENKPGMEQGITAELSFVDQKLTAARAKWEKSISAGIVSAVSKAFAEGLAADPSATGRAAAARNALTLMNTMIKEMPKGISPTTTIKYRAELETTALKADVDNVVKTINRLKAGKVLDESALNAAESELTGMSSLFNKMGDDIRKDASAAKALADALALVAKERASIAAVAESSAAKEQAQESRRLIADRNKANDLEINYLRNRTKQEEADQRKLNAQTVSDRNKMNELEVRYLNKQSQTRKTEEDKEQARRISDRNKANDLEVRYLNKRANDEKAEATRQEKQAITDRNAMNNMEVRYLNKQMQIRKSEEAKAAKESEAATIRNFQKQVDSITEPVTSKSFKQFTDVAQVESLQAAVDQLVAMREGVAQSTKQFEILDKAINKTVEDLIVATNKMDNLEAKERGVVQAALGKMEARGAAPIDVMLRDVDRDIKTADVNRQIKDANKAKVEAEQRDKQVAAANLQSLFDKSNNETAMDSRLKSVAGLANIATRIMDFRTMQEGVARGSDVWVKIQQHIVKLEKEFDNLGNSIHDNERAFAFFEKFNQLEGEFKNIINKPMESTERRAQLEALANRVDVLKDSLKGAVTEVKTLDKFLNQIGAQHAGTYRESDRETKQEQIRQDRIQRKKEEAAARDRKGVFNQRLESSTINKTEFDGADLNRRKSILLSSESVLVNLLKEFGDVPEFALKARTRLKDIKAKLNKVNDEITLEEAKLAGERAFKQQISGGELNLNAEFNRGFNTKDSFTTAGIREKLSKAQEAHSADTDNAKLQQEVERLQRLLFKSRVEDIEGRYKVERAKLAPGQVDEKNKLKDEAVAALTTLRREFKGTEEDAIAFGKKIYKVMAQIAHDTSREIGKVGNEFLDLNGILKRFHDAILAAGNDQTKQLEAYKAFRGELEVLRNSLSGNAEAQQKLINLMIGAAKAVGGLTETSMKQHIGMLQQQYQLDLQEARSVADKRKVYEDFIKTLDAIAPAYAGAVHGAQEFINKEKAGAERLMNSQFRASRGDLMNAVMNVGMMTGGAGAVFKESTDKYAEFSQSMANVNSIMKVSKEEIAGLSNSVLSLSNDPHIAKGPTDLAKGLYDVASAGFEGDKAMEILTAASKGATAGLTDTHTAANILSSTMRAFDYEGMNAGQQMDILFKTVDKGILTFEQLTQHMGPVIQSASMLKVPMQEVGAAISVLTRRGLQPAEAFTALNNVLLGLNSPTKEVTEEARKMGIQWLEAEKAAVHIKDVGLVETLREISEATGGSAEKLQLLLPSMREIRGAAALLADGGFDLIKMNHDFADSLGSTDAALEKQSEGFKHHIEKMQAAWERFMISIGQNNMILSLTDSVTGLINMLNNFPDWIKGGVGLTAGIGALGGLATTVGLVMHALAPMIELLKKESGVAGALGRFGTLVASLSVPLAALAGALGIIGEGFAIYNSEIERADKLSKDWIEDQKKATEEARRMVTALEQKIKSFEKLRDMLKEYSKAADGSAEKTKLMESIMGRLSVIAPDLWLQIRQGSLAFDDLAKPGGGLDRAIDKLKEYLRVNREAAASKFNDNGTIQNSNEAIKAARDNVGKYDKAVALLKTLQLGDYSTKRVYAAGGVGGLGGGYRIDSVDGRQLTQEQWSQIQDPAIRKHLQSLGVVFRDDTMTVRQLGKNQTDIDIRVQSGRSALTQSLAMAEMDKIKATAADFATQHRDDPARVRQYYIDNKIPQFMPEFAKISDPKGTISQQRIDLAHLFKGTITRAMAQEAGLNVDEYAGKSISQMIDAVNKQDHRHSSNKNADLDRLKNAWEKLVAKKFPDLERARTGKPFDDAYMEYMKPFQHEYVDDRPKKPSGSGGRDYEEVARSIADLIEKNDTLTLERRRELTQVLGDMHKKRAPLPAIQDTGDLGMSQALSFLSGTAPNASGSTGSKVRIALSTLDKKGGLKQQVIEAAKQAGVDPTVFATLLYTESTFDPKARGPVDKDGDRPYGIGQMKLGTARDYGITSPDQLYQTSIALPAAAKHFRNAINYYIKAGVPPQEAVKFALAAYNAGPGGKGVLRGVHRAWERAGMSRKFADVAPFLPKETQDYVESIVGISSSAPAQISSLKGVPMVSGKGSTPAQIAATQAFLNNKIQNMRRYTEVVADLDKSMASWMEDLASTGVTPTKLEQLNKYNELVATMREKNPSAYRSLMGTQNGQNAHAEKLSNMDAEVVRESNRFLLDAEKQRITAERAVKQDRLAVLEETHKEEMAEFDKETKNRKKGFLSDTEEQKALIKKFEDDRAAIALAKEKVYQETRLKLIEDSEQAILDIQASVADKRAQITGDTNDKLLSLEEKYAADLHKINVEERRAYEAETDPGRKNNIKRLAEANRRALFISKEQSKRANSESYGDVFTSLAEDWGKSGPTLKSEVQQTMSGISDIMKSTWTEMLNSSDDAWTKLIKIVDQASNKLLDMLTDMAFKEAAGAVGKAVLAQTTKGLKIPELRQASDANAADNYDEPISESGGFKSLEDTVVKNLGTGSSEGSPKEGFEPVDLTAATDSFDNAIGESGGFRSLEDSEPFVSRDLASGAVEGTSTLGAVDAAQVADTAGAGGGLLESLTTSAGAAAQELGALALAAAPLLAVLAGLASIVGWVGSGIEANAEGSFYGGTKGAKDVAEARKRIGLSAQDQADTDTTVGGLWKGGLGGAAIGFAFGGPVGAAIGAAAGMVIGPFIEKSLTSQAELEKQLYDTTMGKLSRADKAAGFIGAEATSSNKQQLLNQQLMDYAKILETAKEGTKEYDEAVAGARITIQKLDEVIANSNLRKELLNYAIGKAGGGVEYADAAQTQHWDNIITTANKDIDRIDGDLEKGTITKEDADKKKANPIADIVDAIAHKNAVKDFTDMNKHNGSVIMATVLRAAGLINNSEALNPVIAQNENDIGIYDRGLSTITSGGKFYDPVTKQEMTAGQVEAKLTALHKENIRLKNEKYTRSPEFDRDLKKNYYDNILSNDTMNFVQVAQNRRESMVADASMWNTKFEYAKKSGDIQAQIQASNEFVKSIKEIQASAFQQAAQEFKEASEASKAEADDKIKALDHEIVVAQRKGQAITADQAKRRVDAVREGIAAQGQLLRTELTRLNLTADEKRKMEAELHSLSMDYINAEADARLEAGKQWIDQQQHLLDLDKQHLDYLRDTSQVSADQAMFSATGTENMYGPQGIVVRQGALAQAVIDQGNSINNKEVIAQGESLMDKAVNDFVDYMAKTQGTMRDTAVRMFKQLLLGVDVPTDQLKAILNPDNADQTAKSWETATKPVTTYADKVSQIGKDLISLSGVTGTTADAMNKAFDSIVQGPLKTLTAQIQSLLGIDKIIAGASTPTGSSSGGSSSSGGPGWSYTAIQGDKSQGGVGSQDIEGGSVSIQDGHYVYTDINGNAKVLQNGGVIGYADGGIVRNPFIGGPPNSYDTVPAWLTPGEEVKTSRDPFHIGNLAATTMLMAQRIGSMLTKESKSVAITVSGNYIHPDMDMNRFAQQLADELTFKGIL